MCFWGVVFLSRGSFWGSGRVLRKLYFLWIRFLESGVIFGEPFWSQFGAATFDKVLIMLMMLLGIAPRIHRFLLYCLAWIFKKHNTNVWASPLESIDFFYVFCMVFTGNKFKHIFGHPCGYNSPQKAKLEIDGFSSGTGCFLRCFLKLCFGLRHAKTHNKQVWASPLESIDSCSVFLHDFGMQ